jgi:hypothetical protein
LSSGSDTIEIVDPQSFFYGPGPFFMDKSQLLKSCVQLRIYLKYYSKIDSKLENFPEKKCLIILSCLLSDQKIPSFSTPQSKPNEAS